MNDACTFKRPLLSLVNSIANLFPASFFQRAVALCFQKFSTQNTKRQNMKSACVFVLRISDSFAKTILIVEGDSTHQPFMVVKFLLDEIRRFLCSSTFLVRSSVLPGGACDFCSQEPVYIAN